MFNIKCPILKIDYWKLIIGHWKFQQIVFICYCFILFHGTSISAQCIKENKAFLSGEKLNYTIYYNMSFIWVDAGTAFFKVNKVIQNNKSLYFFDGYGVSLPKHDWFFKVRESYKSYLDSASLLPVRAERKAIEGSYWTNELYSFDYNSHKIYSAIENSKVKFKRDSIKLGACVFDPISAMYNLRNRDFSKMKINETFPVSTLIDNKVYGLFGRYLGKETIELKDKSKYRCNKFSALLVEGTIFNGGEELFIWASDDENQIPIMIQANILIGSIKVYFTGGEGLKYELSSKIK